MSANVTAGRLEGTAVCCSGGGIRSASYCLGALEALAAEPAERELKVVTAVSGGSYIAAAGALAGASGPPKAGRGAAAGKAAGNSGGRAAYLKRFTPGSEIETRLRDHTHYLMPDAARGLRGIMALLWGAAGNMLLVGSLIFVISALDGWLLSAIGGLTWHGGAPSSMITGVQIWVPASLGLAAVVTYLFSRITERPPAGPEPLWAERWQRWTAALLGLAAAAAVLLVAAPALFAAVWQAGNSTPTTLSSVGTGGTALAVLTAGAVALAKAASGTVSAAWRRLGAVQGTVRPWLVKAGRVVTPWLGSALVVLSFTAFGVYVVGTATAPGYWRWAIAIAAGVFGVLHLLMDVNRSSMHDFYRDRLASAYAARGEASARMSELPGGSTADGTELVICAAANLRSGNPRQDRDDALRAIPPGRGAVSCVFTPSVTELHFPWPESQPETALTGSYEDLIRPDRLTVFDLAAMSGAAVAPLMGKMTSAAHRLLFGAVNLRLGVWLPRPSLVTFFDRRTESTRPDGPVAWHRRLPGTFHGRLHRWTLAWQLAGWDRVRRHHQLREAHSWWRLRCMGINLLWRISQPNLMLLWREVAGNNSAKASWIYVSDGGHYDNLGLVEALRKHPARIHVIDASGDQQHAYATLGQAVALARSEVGVEVSIDPADMEHPPASAHDGYSPDVQLSDGHKPVKISGRRADVVRPFATGSYRYTADDEYKGQTGQIDIVKLGVWGGQDLPWDVRGYFAGHRSFPRDSTLKQLYDDEDFEAYRELGQASMQALLRHRKVPPLDIWITIQN